MRFVNVIIKSILVLTFVALMLVLYTYQAYADQQKDDKCYKVNTQIMSWFPKGLEIDSKGNIYIGSTGGINVYDASGSFKYAIKVKTYGVFQMKLEDNDMLNVALARESTILVYDEEGYIIQEKQDKENRLYNEFEKNNDRRKDLLGNEYKLSNLFGYTKVVKISLDGAKNTIYKISFLFWGLKLLISILLIIFVLLVTLFIVASRKESK
jgi:hypothetical protein